MLTVLLNECRHYWRYVASFCVLYLFALIYFQYASPATTVSVPYVLVWSAALIFSAGFATWQYQYHKSHGRWVFLFHRPVSVKKLYFALLLSGLVTVFVAVIFPILLVTLYTQLLTEQLVEFRHYLLSPSIYPVFVFI